MNQLLEHLRNLESEALRLAETDLPPELADQAKTYKMRLDRLGNSHSHSWFGDHSSTYYKDFGTPPSGRSFDVEWGFIPGFNGIRNPGWRVYSRDEVRAFVFDGIGEDIFDKFHELAAQLNTNFSNLHDQALDAIEAAEDTFELKSLSRYKNRIQEEIKPYSFGDYVNSESRRAPRMTRDSEEIAKGQIVPAHVQYQSSIRSFETNKRRLGELANLLRNAVEATSLSKFAERAKIEMNKVFIGHGRSNQWRVLKDFIKDRIGIDYDEFNRVPVAGIATQERLSEMLSQCGFAFLVLTAEDVHQDATFHARENVVHEAGLFQGKLGWRKAIVLLEDGCEEFSNIAGLGQIRFPKGNIGAIFEDVRGVLEREGFLASR